MKFDIPLIYTVRNRFLKNIFKEFINKDRYINFRDKNGNFPLIYPLRNHHLFNREEKNIFIPKECEISKFSIFEDNKIIFYTIWELIK